MTDEWTVCPLCGFGCLKSQLTKTNGKCPRCNPEEGKKHLDRVAHFKNGGKIANLPEELK